MKTPHLSFPFLQLLSYILLTFLLSNCQQIKESTFFFKAKALASPSIDTSFLQLDTLDIQTRKRTPMDELIGMNAFIDDPIGRIEAVGFVREYHSWVWDEGNHQKDYEGYPNNQLAWNPGAVEWNFDRFYRNLHQLNIMVSPVLQGNVPWLLPPNYYELMSKPIAENEDASDPTSYIEHANYLYQFAARYGSNRLKSSLLKLRADQERLTGLGYVRYLENWNEYDAWWKDRKVYFEPAEYAAMASADYDAHRGKLGETVGVKNADPRMKMVMSGTTTAELKHIEALKEWADKNRAGDLPFDVINVHHYSNDKGGQFHENSIGVSPEADRLKERMLYLVAYRNRFFPDKEVWITEFGYDTHPNSPQRAPKIAHFSQEEVQAQWLVRSYLAIAAAGIDRAAMYMLRDVNENSALQFQTSGLVSSKDTGYKAKASWYYVYTLKNRLKGMIFDGEIESGDGRVMIYRFQHQTDASKTGYVLWCPTANGTEVKDFPLQLPKKVRQAVLVEMEKGDRDGKHSSLTQNEKEQVMVNVSERPVIVLTKSDNDFFARNYLLDRKLELDASMMFRMVDGKKVKGEEKKWVDEQAMIGEVSYGEKSQPKTFFNAGFSPDAYPMDVYLDLGKSKNLSKIALFDGQGKGDCSVAAMGRNMEEWTELFTDNLANYNQWKVFVVGGYTSMLRFRLHSPNVNIAEIAVYVNEATE